MPRAPVAAFFGSVFATAFLALGLALLGWVWVTHREVAVGFDWAVWAARFAPQEWSVDPEAFGNWVIGHQVPVGLSGAFITFLGLVLLQGARRSSRPIDRSDDGRWRVTFKSMPHRVGQRLEGSIFLPRNAQPDEPFKVEVDCIRRVSGSESTETRYVHSQKKWVQAVNGPQGLHLPFTFDVPITAPPTFGSGFLGFPLRHHWRIHAGIKGSWFRSTFDLRMEPPTEQEIKAMGKKPAAGPDQLLAPFTPHLSHNGAVAWHPPWVAAASVVKPAGLIRKQRMAWNVVSWSLLALVVIFYAVPFVAGEIRGK